jgi:hypothetical protein
MVTQLMTAETGLETGLEVVLQGGVLPGVREHALEMMAGLARNTDLQLGQARVRVSLHSDQDRRRRATAQASAQFDGRRIRAHVAAATPGDAVDLLAEVLRHRVRCLRRVWEARARLLPSTAPHEWRHYHERDHSPGYGRRPPAERKVLRHKALELEPCTPDEAIEDMELMGYRFRLFTDLASGQDSVVCRLGPTAYRLTQVKPEPGHIWRTRAAMATNPYPASRLTLAEAVERMNLTGWSFVFYADAATGRGRVVYRRYDGHYGLITPIGT